MEGIGTCGHMEGTSWDGWDPVTLEVKSRRFFGCWCFIDFVDFVDFI